jgi:Glucodextranase, domain B
VLSSILSMIKEIALAITLGALLGFGITGGYLASQKSKKTSTSVPTPIVSAKTTNSPSIAPTPTIANELTTTESILTIDSPKDEDIVANSLLKISGSSLPDSIIVANTNLKHYQTKTSSTGEFTLQVELESGTNNIQIDAFSPDDTQSSVTLQVTYSTAKI